MRNDLTKIGITIWYKLLFFNTNNVYLKTKKNERQENILWKNDIRLERFKTQLNRLVYDGYIFMLYGLAERFVYFVWHIFSHNFTHDKLTISLHMSICLPITYIFLYVTPLVPHLCWTS